MGYKEANEKTQKNITYFATESMKNLVLNWMQSFSFGCNSYMKDTRGERGSQYVIKKYYLLHI